MSVATNSRSRVRHPLYAAARALRRRFENEGAAGALRHVVERSRAQVLERDRHLVVRKDLDDISVPVRRGRLVLETIERRHLPALSALNREREDLTGDARFAGDLEDGYGCFLAYKGDELIGFYWWVDETMPPHREFNAVALGVKLSLGDVYGTDLYVTPAHRGQGTAAELLYLVETAFRDRGFERLWGTVAEDNRPARWLYDSRGYRGQWAVDGTRILRRWRYRTTPLPA